jgi:hypothetical protein
VLARLKIESPYEVLVATEQQFPVYVTQDGEYTVRHFPPQHTPALLIGTRPQSITVNGQPAVEAKALMFEFQKADFNRASGAPLDPPEQVILRAIRQFESRFRYVTRAPGMTPIDFPNCAWRLDFLNNDGNELANQPGLYRSRRSRVVEMDQSAGQESTSAAAA